MKKYIAVSLCTLLILSLCACSGNADASDSKEGVKEFMRAVKASDENEGLADILTQCNFYNVTPEEVKNQTEIRIFKCADCCASYAMLGDKVGNLCDSFGGFGFINAIPCDIDGDGSSDLLVASSFGSGIHRAVISVFNTESFKSTVLYSYSGNDENGVSDLSGCDLCVGLSSENGKNTDVPDTYTVYRADIEGDNNFALLEYTVQDAIGVVKSVGGVPVCIPNDPSPFSYSEETKEFTGSQAGVKTEGFKNTGTVEISDYETAVLYAQNEVTVPYDTVSAQYDEAEQIWKVCFGKSDMLGGDETVYLNTDGATILCVYGE
ncbi:MAG: hypothetical protein ACI3YE_00825 [Candidatus Avispirillum sp.]